MRHSTPPRPGAKPLGDGLFYLILFPRWLSSIFRISRENHPRSRGKNKVSVSRNENFTDGFVLSQNLSVAKPDLGGSRDCEQIVPQLPGVRKRCTSHEIPFSGPFSCVMGSVGCGRCLCKGHGMLPPPAPLVSISVICFTQAPGACRKLRNDNFILKKIFANAICSLYMKSNEQNGRSCLLKEPCRATLFCFPAEVRMQLAFVPVVKTLELSGASKREKWG